MSGELLAFPDDVVGMVLNLEQDQIGAVLFGEDTLIKEGDVVKRHQPHRPGAGRRGDGRPRRQRPRAARRRQGAHRRQGVPAHRAVRARRGRSAVRQGAAADRAQGHRRDDPDRAGPARADHRRPRHRQDRDRRRHDHQPEGAGRLLLLRRHRPEALDGRAGGEDPRGRGRDGLHDRRRRLRLRAGAAPVHRAVRRRHDGGVLPRFRPSRALHLRRPLQARDRVPPALAAAAAAAGTRGVSRATSSICTRGCSSGRPSSTTSSAAARSPRCRSSRPSSATSRPTSRPT